MFLGTHGGTEKAYFHFVYSLSCSVTGDTKYLDRAASAIDAFNKFMPATVAFAGLNNVNSVNGGLIDDMESFWFAEVLKYLYVRLLISLHLPSMCFVGTLRSTTRRTLAWTTVSDALVLVHRLFSCFTDVFNTECQPFKAPPALDSYAGSGSLIKAKPFTVQSGELPQFSPSAFLSAQKSQ
jgi:mannosyl-oligosaccharide alpha-1,2-mannosidase